jgi:hypothetical protein
VAPRFELERGRDGRWLLRDGGRQFVVPADLAGRFVGPDGPRRWRGLLARRDADAAPRRRGLWLRVTLVPASVVRAIAARLSPLAAWPALAILATAGALSLALSPRPPLPDQPRSLTLALAVFLVTALVHESGHAAALARTGWSPGRIGLGVLWVLPVLWCDVSAVALLRVRDRARVDVAGIAFQLAAAGLAAVAATLVGEQAVAVGAYMAVAAVTWNLLPLARTDGYWLACDLFGLPDLARPLKAGAGRGRRLVAAAWRALTAVMLAALVVALPWRLRAWLGPPRPDEPVVVVVARALLIAVLLVASARTLRRVWRLLAAAWRDLRSLRT